ncbi:MAG: nuclear transport factor 2 family protein [Candidatus Acidiferrales bacterium]
MRKFTAHCVKICGALFMLALVLTAFAAPASAQKKNKKNDQPSPEAQTDSKAMLPESDSQAVDRAVGESLGYWQIGDIDSLHKYYSDDVVVVSGAWEPPVVGWDNFLKSYQAQRAAVEGGRVDRSNTYIKVNGNSAWATYQFVYTAMADNRVIQFHGHTSLVLNKQGDRWVIVLNHSSIVDSSTSSPALPADSPLPGRS